MARLYTFPSSVVLDREVAKTPEFMHPDYTPYAVVVEGILSGQECDTIVESLMALDPYVVPGCGAVTRECVSDPSLDIIENVARHANDTFFHFDLHRGQHSWLQTYGHDAKYQRHMDGMPGQVRKLTAVAMLSDSESYKGGQLRLYVPPKSHDVPRTKGTVVVFQHWIEHDVSPVDDGLRQTVNMGFWGPPFK